MGYAQVYHNIPTISLSPCSLNFMQKGKDIMKWLGILSNAIYVQGKYKGQ